MDTPNNVGSEFEDRQRLRYVNLFGPELADDLATIAYVRPEGFSKPFGSFLSQGKMRCKSPNSCHRYFLDKASA